MTTVKVSNKKPQLKSSISQFNQLKVFIYTGHEDKATSKNIKIDNTKFVNIPKTVNNTVPSEPIYRPNNKENKELIKGLIIINKYIFF